FALIRGQKLKHEEMIGFKKRGRRLANLQFLKTSELDQTGPPKAFSSSPSMIMDQERDTSS
ncbi:MAG TPA: hypothetical protein PLK98_00325, partial [Methanothrix sp.]|nr:hypothetical protein [Methanothrix sp.]